MPFWRRNKLPADRTPALEADERVLAWSPAGPDGTATVVATHRGLWLPGAQQRWGWHEIHKASWSGTELTIIGAQVVTVGDDFTVVTDAAPQTFTLTEPGEVPHQIRARVTGAVAFTQHFAGPTGGAGVRVVAHRLVGADGLSWTVRYDQGIDPADPAVRAATAALVAEAKAATAPAP